MCHVVHHFHFRGTAADLTPGEVRCPSHQDPRRYVDAPRLALLFERCRCGGVKNVLACTLYPSPPDLFPPLGGGLALLSLRLCSRCRTWWRGGAATAARSAATGRHGGGARARGRRCCGPCHLSAWIAAAVTAAAADAAGEVVGAAVLALGLAVSGGVAVREPGGVAWHVKVGAGPMGGHQGGHASCGRRHARL